MEIAAIRTLQVDVVLNQCICIYVDAGIPKNQNLGKLVFSWNKTKNSIRNKF